jgi:two-component system response regulator AtoC
MGTIPERRLLIIDDEENMRHMLQALVSRHGYRVETAAGAEEALAAIGSRHFDFILCDVRMPGMDGMDFLAVGADRLQHSTVIMMSAFGSIDTAIEAMKAGAYDFISKPFKADEVIMTLRKAEEREALRRENRLLKEELQTIKGQQGFGNILTKNVAMKSLIRLAGRVASYSTTVLITGESGTGKELLARGVHNESPRVERRFTAVNCGSFPESLLESELFGYVKGAFTGALRDRKGIFEETEKGTLFLDEIGELPLTMQVKILRVLQEGEIRKIGSSRSTIVDVRVLAATAKDLKSEVEKGHFREDLFYRLNVVELKIPPLRERREDIPLLCNHFLGKYNNVMGSSIKAIAPEVLKALMRYNWPGNVRELENVVQRLMVLADNDIIGEDQLSTLDTSLSETNPREGSDNLFSLKIAQRNLERAMIEKALRYTKGNKSRASELLAISYPSLLSKIKEFNIQY